jgi:hypothetical protein
MSFSKPCLNLLTDGGPQPVTSISVAVLDVTTNITRHFFHIMDIVRRGWSFGSYKDMEGEAARFEKLKGWFNSCSVRIHLVPFLQKIPYLMWPGAYASELQ